MRRNLDYAADTAVFVPRPFKTPLVPLVPVLGILTNLFLTSGLGWSNWARLVVWLVIGLAIYFGYSRKHSVVQHSAGR